MSRHSWQWDGRGAYRCRIGEATLSVFRAVGVWVYVVRIYGEVVAQDEAPSAKAARDAAEDRLVSVSHSLLGPVRALNVEPSGHAWRCPKCGAEGTGWKLAPYEAVPGPDGVFPKPCAECVDVKVRAA